MNNSNTKLKRIYVIQCIVTDPITSKVSDTPLIAFENSNEVEEMLKILNGVLNDSIESFISTLILNICSIPTILQEAETRKYISKKDISFQTRSIVLNNRRIRKDE